MSLYGLIQTALISEESSLPQALKNAIKIDMAIQKDFLAQYKLSPLKFLTAAVILLSLLCFSRTEIILNINSKFLGGTSGDGGLYVWLLKNNVKNLFTLPWFNTQAFFPYGLSLAWSDNFILPSLLTWPLLKSGASLALSYNSVILLAQYLNGICTFLLAFMLCGNLIGSLVAGSAFMLSSYLSFNIGHPQLQFAFWLPLALIFLFRFLATPNLLYSFFLGLSIFLSFLCTVYYALFIVLAVLVSFVALYLLRPSYLTKREIYIFISGLSFGVMPLIPFVLPYLKVREAFGARFVYEAYFFSANLVSYFSAPASSLLYGFSSKFSIDEAHLFLGIVAIGLSVLIFLRLGGTKKLRRHFQAFAASFMLLVLSSMSFLPNPYGNYLAALALWILLISFGLLLKKLGALEKKLGFEILTNRALSAIFFLILFFFLAISFGPLGNPDKGELTLGVQRVVYALVPGFDSIRAIARSGIVVLLCLSILSAFGITFLFDSKKLPVWCIYLLALLAPAENLTSSYPIEELVPVPVITQRIFKEALQDDAVLFLPLTSEVDSNRNVKSWADFAALNTRYMNWGLELGLHVLNGYSGQRSNFMYNLPGQMYDFPDSRSLKAVSSTANLRFIVFCSKYYPKFELQQFLKKIEQYKSDFALLDADQSGNYLFEYIGQTKLDSRSSLYLPSFPSGFANLELMGLYKGKGDADIAVEVDLQGQKYTSMNVLPSGLWQEFSFKLPATGDPVRPIKLEFKIPEESNVYLRKRRFSSGLEVSAK